MAGFGGCGKRAILLAKRRFSNSCFLDRDLRPPAMPLDFANCTSTQNFWCSRRLPPRPCQSKLLTPIFRWLKLALAAGRVFVKKPATPGPGPSWGVRRRKSRFAAVFGKNIVFSKSPVGGCDLAYLAGTKTCAGIQAGIGDGRFWRFLWPATDVAFFKATRWEPVFLKPPRKTHPNYLNYLNYLKLSQI